MPLPNKDNIVSRKSTRDIVYSEMLDLIIKGTLKPGEKLIESELTNYFGVSRTPIREAMQLLKELKLVSIIPGQYTIVEPIDLKGMADCYIVLTDLQILAVEESFQKITKENLEDLTTILNGFRIACMGNSIQEVVKFDDDFHNYIVNLTENTYLIDMVKMLQLHVTRLKYIYFDEKHMRNFSVEEHNKILDLFKEKDLENAKLQMKQHWIRVKNRSLEIARIKIEDDL